MTVLRTDNYKRKNWNPYHMRGAKSEDNARIQNIKQSASKVDQQELLNNLNALFTGLSVDNIKEFITQDKEKAKNFYALMDEYPNLGIVLDEIVDARLSLLNSDEPWSQDKNYGWAIRDLDAPVLDEEFQKYVNNVRFNEDTGELLYEQLPSFPTDQEEVEQLKQRIIENFYYHLTEDPMFLPMTKEEAESNGYGWIPSTDEYINGIYESDPVIREFLDKELLYKELKSRLEHKLNNDADRKYSRARERYASEPNQLELPNAVGKFALEAIAPFSAGALFDDELNFKTSPAERVIRGVGDVGLGVASYALPLGLARFGLKKAGGKVLTKIPQLAKTYSKIKSPLISTQATLPRLANNYGIRRVLSEVPQIFGGVADGVIGGLADYGLKRAFDQGLMTVYGDGAQSIHQPITAIDLATYGLLGGLLGSSRRFGTGRAYDDMKRKMNKGDPTKVSRKEVDDYLKLSDEGVDRQEVMNKWAWKAFDDYEQKYPNSARLVMKPPKPEIFDENIDATKKLPLLQISKSELKQQEKQRQEHLKQQLVENIQKKDYIEEDNILYEVVEQSDDAVEQGKRIMQETLGMEVEPLMIPLGYVKPTDEFIRKYVQQNKDYYADMLRNHALAGNGDFYIDNIGLGEALKHYQNKQNLESHLFDGESKILNDKTYKQQKNISTGGSNKGKSAVFGQNQQGKDDFYSKILTDKSKLGTSNTGTDFKPATKEQIKEYEQANKKRRERGDMSDFTRDDFEKAKKEYSNRYTKFMALPFGVIHGINNASPFSRTIGGVQPYTYISPINTEETEDK